MIVIDYHWLAIATTSWVGDNMACEVLGILGVFWKDCSE